MKTLNSAPSKMKNDPASVTNAFNHLYEFFSSFSYLNSFKSVEFMHLTLSGKMEKVTCLLKQLDKDRGSLSLYATFEENSFLTLNEDSLDISSKNVSKSLVSHEKSHNCPQIA